MLLFVTPLVAEAFLLSRPRFPAAFPSARVVARAVVEPTSFVTPLATVDAPAIVVSIFIMLAFKSCV